MLRNATTVSRLAEETLKFEALQCNGITTSSVQRLPNVVMTVSAVYDCTPNLEALARCIVRDEPDAALKGVVAVQQPANTYDIIHQEIQWVISSLPSPALRHLPPGLDPRYPVSNPAPPYLPQTSWPGNFSNGLFRQGQFYDAGMGTPLCPAPYFGPNRAADDHPICFRCGPAGYVRRYCRAASGRWANTDDQAPRTYSNRSSYDSSSTRISSPNCRQSCRQSLSPPPAPSVRNHTPSHSVRSCSPAGNS